MGYSFSPLLISKSSTETILNVSEILLIVSGFVLTFGAIGEYLEEHGKLPKWMKWPKLVFVFMVALSLVGEFLSDAGVFFSSSKLQTISDGEFAGLNKEAGDARKTAGTADERSKLLEASNKQLGIDLEAEKQKTADVEKEAAALRIKAAELEASNIQTERRLTLMSARSKLIDKGESEFLNATGPFKGQKVEIQLCRGLANDWETGMLWGTLSAVLTRAGWDVHTTSLARCNSGLGVAVFTSLAPSD